jgi:glucose/arabinose dehydrogenase
MKRILSGMALLLPLVLAAQINPVRIALHNWATGLSGPVWIANAGDDRLFVVQQGGIIKVVTDSMQVLPTPFLDITSEVNSSGNEQGLLSIAFDPDYATNGYFYVYYIHGSGSGTSRISRFEVSDDPDVADASTEVILYTWPQPFTNHNGGCLQFGPDGYLYCGFGDGGDGNDPFGNGQDLSDPLGDMVRIDVSAHDSGYLVPSDNPWTAATDTLPEIWASGLRNPWRYSFDRLTGDLWIADVGQNAWEEVDFWPAGDNSGPNFGWRCREGLVATPGVSQAGCGPASSYVSPVAVFNHGDQGWCAIIGGYVYRGPSFPHLYGKYIFTDYCAGDFLTFGEDNEVDTVLMTANYGYSAFGQDIAGELYVSDVEHGTVKKVVDACPMPDPTIDYDGLTLISSPADAYQWFVNGFLIPGATQQTCIPLTNGDYSVRADFGAPCLLMSGTISVLNTSMPENGLPLLSVYPQPADDRIRIELAGGLGDDAVIGLFDALGRPVRSMEWAGGASSLEIPVADLAEGAYVLRAMDRSGILMKRKVMVVH